MTPEPNRHSKGISEKKSTSDVFNNNIVREFREAMKQVSTNWSKEKTDLR